MANVQYSHNMGHVGFQREPVAVEAASTPVSNVLKRYTNLIGAVLSVSLIAGVGIWGFQLIMRDVSGIPVVKAAQGDMRERPEDPGGQLALHQGLAVNEVAADGQASGPVDKLVLAPRPTELSEEDQPMTLEAAASLQQAAAAAEAAKAAEAEPVVAEAAADEAEAITQPDPLQVAEALESGDIDKIVAELTQSTFEAEVTPAAATAEVIPAVTNAAASLAEVKQVARPALYTGPGLKLSKRPQLRPLGAARQPVAVTPVAAVAEDSVKELDGSNLPVGTRLVQLGALDSPETARKQWDRLAAKFGDYMQGKDRVIMKATSGGRSFYRLRAVGFTDLSDARRFCSALVAEGADCIPVVTR